MASLACAAPRYARARTQVTPDGIATLRANFTQHEAVLGMFIRLFKIFTRTATSRNIMIAVYYQLLGPRNGRSAELKYDRVQMHASRALKNAPKQLPSSVTFEDMSGWASTQVERERLHAIKSTVLDLTSELTSIGDETKELRIATVIEDLPEVVVAWMQLIKEKKIYLGGGLKKARVPPHSIPTIR